MKQFQLRDVQGYKVRIKGLPTHEQKEPNIAYYASMEKRKRVNTFINKLVDTDGSSHSDTKNLLRISTDFYRDLYTPTSVNTQKQHKLIQNLKRAITKEQREELDAPLTKEDLSKSVSQLNLNKSPGLDGIPSEFYKQYWRMLEE